MAWHLYIQRRNGTSLKVPVSFKTKDDARLFHRKNKDLFEDKDGTDGEPVYVERTRRGGKKGCGF